MDINSFVDGLFYSGQKVETGMYYCAECLENPETVIITKSKNKLPKCPKCGRETSWAKLQ